MARGCGGTEGRGKLLLLNRYAFKGRTKRASRYQARPKTAKRRLNATKDGSTQGGK